MSAIASLGAALRRGEVTAVAVAEAALERIEEQEPRLNAFVTVTRERALAEAAAVDAALAGGEDLGPLMGVPVAVKDVLAADGAPTTGASQALRDHRPAPDAEVVARLARAGAVLVGKTNLHELGWGLAPELGRANNPLDPALTAGGSSGGSAATVASGAVPAAIGTDAGGSIRIPAAFCGLVGLKPTDGRVSGRGHLPAAWSLGVAGPLTRTVADAELVFAAIADPPRRTASLAVPPRLGVVTAAIEAAEPTIAGAVRSACEGLRASGRCTLVEVDVDLRGSMAAWSVTYFAETAAALEPWLGERVALVSDDLRTLFALARRIPATAYVRAQQARTLVDRALQEALAGVDALVTPAVPAGPTEVEPEWGDDDYVGSNTWLVPANLTGRPALVLPLDPPASGAALQLVGRRGGDEALLTVGRIVEAEVRPFAAGSG